MMKIVKQLQILGKDEAMTSTRFIVTHEKKEYTVSIEKGDTLNPPPTVEVPALADAGHTGVRG